jgi:hypothetical protein
VVQSAATTNITDTGVASAQSGSADAGVTGAQPVVVASPAPATGPSSGPAVSTGLTTSPSVGNQFQVSRVVPGGTTSSDPVNITQTQLATVFTGGSGVAASGAGCGGPACATSSAAAPSGATATQPTQAVSGPGIAQGLVADNTVTTQATASVSVAGRNFALIQVVMDAVTRIANWGSASAVSGAASSSSGPASGPAHGSAVSGSPAASGATQALGAQVHNQIDLSSSTNVRVTGDNHNPINVVLNLAASLLNLGIGVARSGDAQTSATSSQASGVASATSGSAAATGLAVQNAVNLQADASIQVDGDNYAPISIAIHFDTAVDNRGWAQASTGAAQAGATPAPPSNGGAGSGHTTARSGPATVIGDMVKVNAVSVQSANANGVSKAGQTPDSQASASAAAVPAGATTAAPQKQSPPDPAAPSSTPSGAHATSGAALASGIETSANVLNIQTSACTTPATGCAAANSSSVVVQVEPAASADPPLPTIPGQPGQPGSGNSSTGSGAKATSGLDRSDAPASPSGPAALVNPFADVVARRLPPLPKQPPRVASGVIVGQDPWSLPPAAPDQLPALPASFSEPDAGMSVAVTTTSAPGTGAPPISPSDRGRTEWATSPSTQGATETQPAPPPMADVNPWTVLPEAQRPAMPAQIGRPVSTQPMPVSAQPVAAELATAALPQVSESPQPAAATPLDPFVFGIGATAGIGLVLASAASTPRARRWLARQLRRWLALLRFF